MVGVYGVTHRLNLLSNVPYIWTEASQGVLHGMNGVQDLSIAAKYTLLEREQSPVGALRLLGVFAAAFPLTDYTPDFQPLSIGSASTRLSWRGTASMQGRDGTFVDASGAFTWRSNVTLDRPYYFTERPAPHDGRGRHAAGPRRGGDGRLPRAAPHGRGHGDGAAHVRAAATSGARTRRSSRTA